VETDQGSAPVPGGGDEIGVAEYKELGERISTILRTAEEAAEAILQNAVQLAEQARTEAHERASAELDAAQRDVESARQEAAAARAEAEGFRSSRATDALHIQEMAAQDMRQLAEEIASRRQELERASRVFEERLSRLATDIEPAEWRSRSPAVATLASGSASASAREPGVERMVELAVAIVLAAAFVAAMIFLLILIA
jgi:hypothetical protein